MDLDTLNLIKKHNVSDEEMKLLHESAELYGKLTLLMNDVFEHLIDKDMEVKLYTEHFETMDAINKLRAKLLYMEEQAKTLDRFANKLNSIRLLIEAI